MARGWELEHSVDEALRRLAAATVPMTSLWFPTQAEQTRWDTSTAPCWSRRTGRRTLLLGPRLPTIAAARMVPMVVAELSPRATGCSVRLQRWLPLGARVVFVGWSVLLVLWGAALGRGVLPLDGLVFFLVLAAFLALTATLSLVLGGRELDAHLTRLRAQLDREDVGADDWA
jgi:hypothetical protein